MTNDRESTGGNIRRFKLKENNSQIMMFIVHEGNLDRDNIVKVIYTNEEDLDAFMTSLKTNNPNGDFRVTKIVVDPSQISSTRTV